MSEVCISALLVSGLGRVSGIPLDFTDVMELSFPRCCSLWPVEAEKMVLMKETDLCLLDSDALFIKCILNAALSENPTTGKPWSVALCTVPSQVFLVEVYFLDCL